MKSITISTRRRLDPTKYLPISLLISIDSSIILIVLHHSIIKTIPVYIPICLSRDTKSTAMANQISLRPPTTSKLPQVDWIPPPVDHLSGVWHVTQSSLPLWSDKRNVTITYKALEPTTGKNQQVLQRLDDTVAYQSLTSGKFKTVHGIDTACDEGTADWDWRGTGWLKLVTSHWEILGFGQDSGSGVDWAVVFFASTYLTPSGVDILSNSKEGVSAETLSAIKEALTKVDDPVVKKLAGELFEVRRD